MFKKIGYVIHFVPDAAAALPFYTDVLGLRLIENYDNVWIELDAGNTVFALHSGQKSAQPPAADGPYCKLSFSVDNLDAAITHLKTHGVRLEYQPNEVGPNLWETSFRAPDGNMIGMSGPR
jgi:catechol 2,3-dioxygenase-like lactoylglutathione lyase family enzyme